MAVRHASRRCGSPCAGRSALAVISGAMRMAAFMHAISSEQARSRPQGTVQLRYDPNLTIPVPRISTVPPPGFEALQLPIRVAGLPPRPRWVGAGARQIEVPGGVPHPDVRPSTDAVEATGDPYRQTFNVGNAACESLRREPASLRATFTLQVLSDQASMRVPLRPSAFVAPEGGTAKSVQMVPTPIPALVPRRPGTVSRNVRPAEDQRWVGIDRGDSRCDVAPLGIESNARRAILGHPKRSRGRGTRLRPAAQTWRRPADCRVTRRQSGEVYPAAMNGAQRATARTVAIQEGEQRRLLS